MCVKCKKVHSKLKLGRNHTYTTLAERSKKLKTGLVINTKTLKMASDKLTVNVKRYEAAINEIEATQKIAALKSKSLRKAFHEDIDKYFDTIDERIETYCRGDLKKLNDQNNTFIEKMRECDNMTADMHNLLQQNEIKLIAKTEAILSQAKALSQSLAGLAIDAIEVKQVCLERGQDWSLEGAVVLYLQKANPGLELSVSQT